MKFLAVLIAVTMVTLANADVKSMAGSKRLIVGIPGLVGAHVLPHNIGASAGPVGASIDSSGTTTTDPEHGTVHHTWAELAAAQQDSRSSFSDLEARTASIPSNADVDARTESAPIETMTKPSTLIAASGSSSLDYSPSTSSIGQTTSSAGATDMENAGAGTEIGAGTEMTTRDGTGLATGNGSKDGLKAADVGTAVDINGKGAATRGISPSEGQSDKDNIGKRLMMGSPLMPNPLMPPFLPNLIPSAADISAMAPVIDDVIKDVPGVIHAIKGIMPKKNSTESQQGQMQPQQVQSNSTDAATTPSAGTNTTLPNTAGTDSGIPITAGTNTKIPVTGEKSSEVAQSKGQSQGSVFGKRRTVEIGIQSHQALKIAKKHKGKRMVRKRESAPVDPESDALVGTT